MKASAELTSLVGALRTAYVFATHVSRTLLAKVTTMQEASVY